MTNVNPWFCWLDIFRHELAEPMSQLVWGLLTLLFKASYWPRQHSRYAPLIFYELTKITILEWRVQFIKIGRRRTRTQYLSWISQMSEPVDYRAKKQPWPVGDEMQKIKRKFQMTLTVEPAAVKQKTSPVSWIFKKKNWKFNQCRWMLMTSHRVQINGWNETCGANSIKHSRPVDHG